MQPAQLSARGGKVRCGRCATVFDGISNLFDLPAPAPEPAAPPQPGLFDAPAPAAPVAPAPAVEEPVVEAAPPTPDPGPEFFFDIEPAPREATPAEPPASAPAPDAAVADAKQEPLLEGFLAEPPPRRRRLATAAWALLAIGALAALAFQVAIRYRAEVAVVAPQARGILEAVCRLAHCELRLPRRVEFVTIESSELQADPRRENLIQLEAVIRNRAPFAQEFPALELTLTDDSDSPVVRRVLTPAEYLGAEAARLPAGMPPQSETPVRMRFDNSQARGTGYKLYLFFP